MDGPACKIEVFEPWAAALSGLEALDHVDVLYWLDRARRDLVLQNPASGGKAYGTFAIRSPLRPNPIGRALARLAGIEGCWLTVHGLDCCDGTPLIDLKPERCPFAHKTEPPP